MDADRAVAHLAECQHGLVSRTQALRCGLSSAGVGRRLESGQWERVHQGVYRLSGTRKTLDQAILGACFAAGRTAAASHGSAAFLLGLPFENPAVEITVAERRRVELRGVVVHRSRRLERVDLVTVRGIPTTSVARTLIDLAMILPTKAFEDALDHALANRLIPIAYLHKRLESLRSGRDGAAALAHLLRARPTGRRPRQSDPERELLRGLRTAGIPLPEAQFPIKLSGGRYAYPDICYVKEKLIVEVDSYMHHSSLTDWEEDHLRNRDLVTQGWRILPVTPSEIRRSPTAVADKIREALAG